MNELIKVENTRFGSLTCNIYSNKKGDFFMTRQQIGQALEYSNPDDSIYRIHERHKERLDKFSVTVKLSSTDNKYYDTILYSAKGVYEICRWSRQPKADLFYDFVYEILEGLRLGYLKLKVEKQTEEWQQTRLQSKTNRRLETDEIKDLIEYAKKQGSKNMEKQGYVIYSKLANKVCGISDRNNATISQLNNLVLVESILKNCIKNGIEENRHYKEIYQDCKDRLNQFLEITYLKIAG